MADRYSYTAKHATENRVEIYRGDVLIASLCRKLSYERGEPLLLWRVHSYAQTGSSRTGWDDPVQCTKSALGRNAAQAVRIALDTRS